MKNFIQLFSIVTLVALLGACTSTNSLTYCPDFKKKNNAKKNFALNFKKKQSKKHKAIVRKTKSIQNKIEWANAVNPLERITTVSVNNDFNASEQLALNHNTLNLDHYIFEELSKKINDQFNLEISTASLKTMIEEKQVEAVENLGLATILEKGKVKPLSKKEIKEIKKTVKAEIIASLNEVKENDIEDGKAAAAVAYLFLVGLLISILALHQKGNTFSAFHIRQAIGITIMGVILSVIAIIPIAGWIAAAVGALLLFISWIIGLINSLNGSSKPVFFFGKAFQKWFSGIE